MQPRRVVRDEGSVFVYFSFDVLAVDLCFAGAVSHDLLARWFRVPWWSAVREFFFPHFPTRTVAWCWLVVLDGTVVFAFADWFCRCLFCCCAACFVLLLFAACVAVLQMVSLFLHSPIGLWVMVGWFGVCGAFPFALTVCCCFDAFFVVFFVVFCC